MEQLELFPPRKGGRPRLPISDEERKARARVCTKAWLARQPKVVNPRREYLGEYNQRHKLSAGGLLSPRKVVTTIPQNEWECGLRVYGHGCPVYLDHDQRAAFERECALIDDSDWGYAEWGGPYTHRIA